MLLAPLSPPSFDSPSESGGDEKQRLLLTCVADRLEWSDSTSSDRLISAVEVPAHNKRKHAPAEDEGDCCSSSPEGSQPIPSSSIVARPKTRSASIANNNNVRPVREPNRPELLMLHYHDLMDLWLLEPPVGGVKGKATAWLYQDTEPIGKYLIGRGFPLLGAGSATLTFQLTERWVAKVARYGWDSRNNKLTVRHFQERNRDLMMCAEYPSCFAESRLTFVNIIENEYSHVDGSWQRTVVVPHRLYVQELLQAPFIYEGLDDEQIDNNENACMLREFIRNHPDPNPRSNSPTILKQWAWTRRKKMETALCEGGSGVQHELDIEWLVCFDYK
jgi:hypothetical protein